MNSINYTKKRYIPIFILIFLFSINTLNAQYIDIVSAGHYPLTGKRFYLSSVVSDSLGLELNKQQFLSLSNYVEEAMEMRGAARVLDSTSADFCLRVFVNISSSEERKEISDKGALSNSFRAFRFNGRNDFMTYTADRYNSAVGRSSYSNPNLPYYRSSFGETKKNRVLATSNYQAFKKELFLDAYIIEGNEELPIWNTLMVSQSVISRKYLCPSSAMLYIAAGSVGRNIKHKVLSLVSAEDRYCMLFSGFNLRNSVSSLFPAYKTNEENLDVVLIEGNDLETRIVFEDRNLLNLDFRKSRDIVLKVDEQSYIASRVKYGSPPVSGVDRFLTASFPVSTNSGQELKIIVFKDKKHKKVLCELRLL